MPQTPINEVLAGNLRYWMTERGISAQTKLATLSGVSQRTIGNYLNPHLRTEGSRGKAPSGKLTELEKIAGALNVQVWELLRPLSDSERRFYHQVDLALQQLKATAVLTTPKVAELIKLAVHEPDKRYE